MTSNGRKNKRLCMIAVLRLRGKDSIEKAFSVIDLVYAFPSSNTYQKLMGTGYTTDDLLFILQNKLLHRAFPNQTITMNAIEVPTNLKPQNNATFDIFQYNKLYNNLRKLRFVEKQVEQELPLIKQ